ncbi:MAG TPA: response regulator [Paracoccaceae bacterium]|nr:response regulator [Paracoccaceae bacterium]
MRVLIVEHNADLGRLWARFLARRGVEVEVATSQVDAIKLLRFHDYDALVLQLVLPDGGAIAISDYATYRNPGVPIITVTNSAFFSDGSIFELIPNARTMLNTPVRPDDLAALIEHFGRPRDEPVLNQKLA